MPILISVRPEGPLTQGDVLKDVPLYRTGGDWGVPTSVRAKSPFALVISRPCVALYKDAIVVAAIEWVNVSIPKADTLDGVLSFLEELRDGIGMPDRFYLGQQIPTCDKEGRFFARLDSLHTVVVQRDQGFSDFLQRHRVATLDEDFRRDLHRRIFSSFASLGFDDSTWYSDQDLNWLVDVGRQELSKLKNDIAMNAAEISKNIASGSSGRNTSLNSAVQSLQEKARTLEGKLGDFESELAKRRRPANTP